MKILRMILISTVFSAFAASGLMAYKPVYGIDYMAVPDSSEIRKQAEELWFFKDIEVIREFPSEIHKNSVGQNFQISLEEDSDNFSVIVAPETSVTYEFHDDSNPEAAFTRESVNQYPADACGSFILERDIATGKAKSVRFYFTNDSGVYVQFSKKGEKTLADYVIGGYYAARSVPVGVRFENLYTASISEVRLWTQKSLPWRYSDVSYGQYAQKLHMIDTIRKNLNRVSMQYDAAYDENEKPIRISDGSERSVSDDPSLRTLSSAGFVKWIVDGLVKPLSGSGTYLKPLLRPTVYTKENGYAGIRQAKDNLSFTLDWTRNLAAARLSVQTKRKYLYEESGVDVNINPFSATQTQQGLATIAGYMKNSGYKMDALPSVLYVLGSTEPTYFYLAAIRKKLPSVPGKSAEIYTFDEAAVIFPYFDKNGSFECIVFQNGKEVEIDDFISKNSDCFVHLTRVLTSDRFRLF